MNRIPLLLWGCDADEMMMMFMSVYSHSFGERLKLDRCMSRVMQMVKTHCAVRLFS